MSRVKMKLMEIDVPSPTGRIYSKEVLEESIKKYNDREDKFVTIDQQSGSIIDISNVCGTVQELKIEDNQVIGIMNTYGTPKGRELDILINNG